MPKLRHALAGAALIVLLGGCADYVNFRNPQTGETARCGPYFATLRPTSESARDCVADYYRLGFVRVP